MRTKLLPMRPRLIVWLAQGFGLGRIPWAPGTFGSLGGLLLFYALASLPNAFIQICGAVLGVGLAIGTTGIAEKLLNAKDPGSVVLDEIVAVPLCFVTWIAVAWYRQGDWPAAEFFLSREHWLISVGVLGAFRVFDILKPWPVRQVQSLPGGFGVVLDDIAAAAYVNLCVAVVYLLKPGWFL